ncbi:MAG: hypothetical protein Q9219_006494 [cf. Caloplaca sp. 3 TL-2023]
MPASSTSSTKRMRSTNDDAQRPLDPSEELSQVAGLVERRRLQNKISQRNYRNRIRDRLEALEALVDNTSKGQINAKTAGISKSTKLGTVKRKIEEGARQSPPAPSTVMPPETTNPCTTSWNMGDFLDTSTTQFDNIYDFPAPQSPVSTQAFPDHTSTRECSPSNHPSTTAMASMNINPKQSTAGLEEIEGNGDKPRPLDQVPPHVTSGSMSPPTMNGQPVSFNPVNYGYPITPMSVPMQPMTPVSLPPHIDRPEANHDPMSQPGSFPFPMPHMQGAGYLQPQQFVWVPVPIMTLPPPPASGPNTMMDRPPMGRPDPLGGDSVIGRRC